jgi:amino acid adenylation domain-containing protein
MLSEHLDLSGLLQSNYQYVKSSEINVISEPHEKEIQVTGDLYELLKCWSHTHGVTLNAILQYAWHKALSAYGNTQSTVVRVMASGCYVPVDGIEHSEDLYINTVPLLVEHKDSDSLLKAIHSVQTSIDKANAHNNINLTESKQGEEPLFDSIFIFKNYALQKQDKEGVTQPEFKPGLKKLNYSLVTIAYEHEHGIKLTLRYTGEIFDPNRIESLLSLLEQLLQQLVSLCPDTYTYHLDLLPKRQQDILSRWNSTRCTYPNALTLQEQFENQVKKTPNNVALITDNDVKLSYQEINESSNRLGHYLRKHYGVKADDRIGICCDRNESLLIGVLGVLKSGGAYVPLDGCYPDERLEYMLSDIDAKVILTSNHYAEKLKNIILSIGLKTPVLSLEDERLVSGLALESIGNPLLINNSNNLACIMYTSGSTGKPKGVMIEHKGITNRCYWQYQQFPFQNNEVCCCKTSLNFVDHIAEIFAPLLTGRLLVLMGTYILPSQLDLSQLIAKLKEHKVTRLVVVPNLLDLLLDWPNIEDLSSLNYCFCSGEVLSAALTEKCKHRFPSLTLVNVYGASEVNADVSYTVVSGYDPHLRHFVPDEVRLQYLASRHPSVGRPLNNCALYVLNAQLKQLPVGVVGELYVAGDVLSRGYWNASEITEARFIDNPFQSEKEKAEGYGARLYKTGDWVCWREDGELEFVGRNDFQIKLRGMRLNLIEVQTALDCCEGIKESAVFPYTLLQPGAEGSKLVAYYISDRELSPENILFELKKKLTDYMVPAYFIPLKAWPLNANGKLDRLALPKPTYVTKSVLLPRNDMEQGILKCFSSLLELTEAQIGIDQDFFHLGGDSILAIKLYYQIIDRFGEHCIQMSSLLADTSIMAISQKIEESYQQGSEGEIIEF